MVSRKENQKQKTLPGGFMRPMFMILYGSGPEYTHDIVTSDTGVDLAFFISPRLILMIGKSYKMTIKASVF